MMTRRGAEINRGNRIIRRPFIVVLIAAGAPIIAQGKKPPPARIPFTADRAKALQEETAKALGVPIHIASSIGMKIASCCSAAVSTGNEVIDVRRRLVSALREAAVFAHVTGASSDVIGEATRDVWPIPSPASPSSSPPHAVLGIIRGSIHLHSVGRALR